MKKRLINVIFTLATIDYLLVLLSVIIVLLDYYFFITKQTIDNVILRQIIYFFLELSSFLLIFFWLGYFFLREEYNFKDPIWKNNNVYDNSDYYGGESGVSLKKYYQFLKELFEYLNSQKLLTKKGETELRECIEKKNEVALFFNYFNQAGNVFMKKNYERLRLLVFCHDLTFHQAINKLSNYKKNKKMKNVKPLIP